MVQLGLSNYHATVMLFIWDNGRWMLM